MNTIIYLIGSISTILCIVICFVLFCLPVKKGNGEKMVLDNKTGTKPWSLGTWIAGVFVAGTGVALMYAPGDLVTFSKTGLNPLESIIIVSLLNGMPVWALYSVMGLWYMNHMDSKIGKVAAMLSTVLGMAISLWTGMNTVIRFIGINVPGFKFMLAAITVVIAVFSARFGFLKKMSKLAFLVFLFAFLALLATPLNDFEVKKISGFITENFWQEYFLGATSASWIFWFLSWTPTVARWLAHISNGRTMKEYIAGTMILPTVLAFVWMTVSWKYQDIIMSFNLIQNPRAFIPAIIFITSGILFMVGTLDSDCHVFTEDLELLTKGRIQKDSSKPYYGLFVLFIFCLFISGIIKNPFGFNEYSSMLFLPLLAWSIINCLKMLKNK